MLIALLAGCVVAPPPEYDEPRQTPPILLVAQADPPVTAIVNIPLAAQQPIQEFSVPVRSEDVGERLVGVLVASYGQAEEVVASRATIVEPASWNDRPREIRVAWNYGSFHSGCYQLSLVVTHYDNFDLESYLPRQALDDIDIVTWWVNLADSPPGSTPVAACPEAPPIWGPF